MKKICAKCGIIFEVKKDPKFCSDKCARQFQQSSLGCIKKPTPPRKVFVE